MARNAATDFPVRCELPIAGEDASYVLYGSGGCSLYDAGKLALWAACSRSTSPPTAKDLDLGFRAWARRLADGLRLGLARRAPASRHHLTLLLRRAARPHPRSELSTLSGTAVESPALFSKLWREAVYRLRLLKAAGPLRFAAQAPLIAVTRPAPFCRVRVPRVDAR